MAPWRVLNAGITARPSEGATLLDANDAGFRRADSDGSSAVRSPVIDAQEPMQSYQTIERGLFLIFRTASAAERAAWYERQQFSPEQRIFLEWVGSETAAMSVDELEHFLFDHRSAMAERFPGYIHAKDTERLLHAGEPSRYYELLRDKSVVLVGPAATSTGSAQGAFIDSFDIVVRMNQQWPVAPADRSDLGSRIDVLYHCCNGDFPVDAIFSEGTDGLRFICYELGAACFRMIALAAEHGIATLNVSRTYYELEPVLGTYPSTGMAAITHLAAAPLSRLHLTGMTMFHTGYRPGYQASGNVPASWEGGRIPESVGPHGTAPQLRQLGKLVKRDPRLSVDEPLSILLGR